MNIFPLPGRSSFGLIWASLPWTITWAIASLSLAPASLAAPPEDSLGALAPAPAMAWLKASAQVYPEALPPSWLEPQTLEQAPASWVQASGSTSSVKTHSQVSAQNSGPAHSQAKVTEDARGFVDWCDRRDQAPADWQVTLELMLRVTETQDCRLAHQRLGQMTALVMPGGGLTNLEPISWYPQLQRLVIRNSAVTDLKPLAKLTQLTDLDLSGQPEVPFGLLMSDRRTASDRSVTQAEAVQGGFPSGGFASGGFPSVDVSGSDVSGSDVSGGAVFLDYSQQTEGRTGGAIAEGLKQLSFQPGKRVAEETSGEGGNGEGPQSQPARPFVWGNVIQPAPKNQIRDLAPLGELKQLRSLDLGGNQITDIRPLAALPNLQVLSIHSNPLRYLDALEQMPQLVSLDVNSIQSRNFGPVSKLRNLERLNLANNGIDDLRLVQKLKRLQLLDLSINEIEDLRPLAHLDGLRWLNLDHNRIADLRPIGGQFTLEALYLRDNQIRSLQPISGMSRLRELMAWDNPLVRPQCPIRREDQSSTVVCQFQVPGGGY